MINIKKYNNIYTKKFGYFNLYVIKGKYGDVLIDTGFICIKKPLKKWLDNFNIKLIILTHAHVDHIWNVAYLKKLYNCEIAIGKLDVKNINNREISSTPSNNRHKYWTKLMHFGMKKFIPKAFDIDYELEDKQIIKKYGLKLKIVSLPGHTVGSIGIVYKDYLFCGDALVNRKIRKVEIAYQNQNNDSAIDSVLKIIELNPKLIFIGHDKEITNTKLEKSFSNLIKEV